MINGIQDMTSFELNVLNQYNNVSDMLMSFKREEIDAIYQSCNRAIQNKIMEDPSIEGKVEQNFINMITEVVDEIRQESSVAESIIQDVCKILTQYYSAIFSKINMVQATNGTLSSRDFCLNYRNCKVAANDLATLLQQKQQLRDKR